MILSQPGLLSPCTCGMVAVVNACLSFWASPPAGDEDDLIVDHRTIARAYLRGWFFFAARPAHRDTSAVPSGAQLLMYEQAAETRAIEFARGIQAEPCVKYRQATVLGCGPMSSLETCGMSGFRV